MKTHTALSQTARNILSLIKLDQIRFNTCPTIYIYIYNYFCDQNHKKTKQIKIDSSSIPGSSDDQSMVEDRSRHIDTAVCNKRRQWQTA